MLDGIKALLGSEKALVGGSLVIAATVLVALGHMTVGDWQSYTQAIFYGYIGGKTVQGAVSVWADTKKMPQPDEVAQIVTEIKAGMVAAAAAAEDKVEEKTEEKKS